MAKEVFEQSLDEILELDRGLDVNSVFESIPAIDTEEKKKAPEDEKETKADKALSLENINKVLERQIKETESDVTKVGTETKEEPKGKDDEAPASLEQPTDDTSDAPFTVIFARDLVKQGLLSSFDEEEFTKKTKELGDAEALRDLIKTEIDANITAAKSDLDLGYQEYLDLIGKGVPVETAGSLVELKNRFESIKVDELTKEESTDLRKQVMTDYFKLTTSMPDKKIEKAVQSSIDLGDDIEDSKEYLTALKGLVSDQLKSETEVAERQQKLIEEENRRSLEKLKDDINALDEVIPGVNINKQTKVQMFESITKPVQDGKGRTTNALWAKRAEDPIFFDQRLAYLYATGFFEKGKPWTKAVQSKATKEISDLEKVLDKKKNTESRSGSPVLRNPEQEKTVKDNIDAMRGVFGR